MTVFFTSDLHFGHRKVAELRGFDAEHDHDSALAERWHETVRSGDQVWILGDLAASSPTYALELLRTLPGEKHLIAGNHDRCHPMHRDAHKHLQRYLGVFASVASAGRRRVNGQEVLLSHFPYHRDRDEVRYAQWRLRDQGVPLLHGHTHGDERLTVERAELYAFGRARAYEIVTTTPELHVGVDAWNFTPVALEQVAELLATVTRAA